MQQVAQNDQRFFARQYRRATYKEIGKFIIFDLIVERNLQYFASLFSLAWLTALSLAQAI